MVITKMKKAKINCRECGCSSLNSVAKKKIRGYKTLIHTFTKRTEDYKNHNNTNNNSNKKNSNKKTKTKQKNIKQKDPIKERR